MLPQQQKLAFTKLELRPVDAVVRRAAAHIDHFDVVVRVLGEGDKARVRTNRDELAGREQLVAGNDVAAAVHIETAVDLPLPGQDRALLGGDLRKLLQKSRVHAVPP